MENNPGNIPIPRPMTIVEVLNRTANDLGLISVPRVLNEQIGVPIDIAIERIRSCLKAIEENERKNEDKKNDEQEPESIGSDEKEAQLE